MNKCFQTKYTCATLVSFVMNRHKQQQDETWDRFTRWTSSLLCFSIIMLSSSVVKLEFWVFRREQNKTEEYQYTMLSRCKRGDCLPTNVQSSPFPVRCRIPIWNLKRKCTEKSVWAIGIVFKYVYKCTCYKWYKYTCTMDTYVPTSLHATLIWSPPSFPSWTRVSFFLAPNRWSVEFQTSEKQLHNGRKVVQFKKSQKHREKKSHCTTEGNSKNIGNTMVVVAMMQHHETPINTMQHYATPWPVHTRTATCASFWLFSISTLTAFNLVVIATKSAFSTDALSAFSSRSSHKSWKNRHKRWIHSISPTAPQLGQE